MSSRPLPATVLLDVPAPQSGDAALDALSSIASDTLAAVRAIANDGDAKVDQAVIHDHAHAAPTTSPKTAGHKRRVHDTQH